MKFFTVIAALAAVAAAAPAADLAAAEEGINLVARQGGSCSPNGQYGCYANIVNPNDRFEFIGQCANGRVVLIARCSCYEQNGIPYCS